MDDLAKRLRKLVIMDEVGSNNPLARDAADRIEALEAQVRVLDDEANDMSEHSRVLRDENERLRASNDRLLHKIESLTGDILKIRAVESRPFVIEDAEGEGDG